ncbi:MAG: TolC family protein [Treponema sp.]|nr:TolC family protein [Treponema sp.]
MKKNSVYFVFAIVSLIYGILSGSMVYAISFEDALNTAVAHSYEIQNQHYALQNASGQLRSVKGTTDITVGASSQYSDSYTPYDPDDPYYGKAGNLDNTETKSLQSSVWLQKLFSFGLQSKLSLGLNRNVSLYTYRDGSLNMGENAGYGKEYTNTGTVQLELSLPLFKSFNASVTSHNIKAAQAYYDQMVHTFEDSLCKLVMNTADAYWKYLLAHNNLVQLEKIHGILQDRYAGMDKLIAAGVRAKNDLLSMQVDEINNDREILSAMVAYDDAKMALKDAMGVSGDVEIGDPAYDFPTIDFSEIVLPQNADIDDAYIAQLVASRPDMRALQKQVESAYEKLKAVKSNSHPDAAINFSVGSTGTVYSDKIREYLFATNKNTAGKNIGGGISFSTSLQRNEGKGSVESAEASYKQAELAFKRAKESLDMQLRNVVIYLNKYRTHMVQAEDSLALQEKLYSNERKRFEAGLITINDISDQDTKYLNAQLQYYQMFVSYLQYAMKYKYYTGALVGVTDSDRITISKDSLYTVAIPAKK